MGNRTSSSSSTQTSSAKSQIAKTSAANKKEKKPKEKSPKYHIRLLTLGISGSGKTTFAKQMKIISQVGFSDTEKTEYQEIIYYNIKMGLQELVVQCPKLKLQCSTENLKRARYFEDIDLFGEFTPKMAETARKLWADPAIQSTWRARFSFPLQIVNLDYLMENLERIMTPGYIPSDEDILRIRQRTTGEKVTNFVNDKARWELIDVGGQKPEREKWDVIVHSKEGLDAILYFVAVDEFNILSSDEPLKTKFDISFEIWNMILNNLKQITIILFLNKMDLLTNKLNQEEDREQFKNLFPNYTGTTDVTPALELIKQKFLNKAPGREITSHNICALDTNLINLIFKLVRKTIFDLRIQTSGLKL